jgi:hypothetical protein
MYMPTREQFKPPLSLQTLRDMQDQNRGNPVVKALLWEIRRLQATVIRAEQLVRTIDESGGHPHHMVLDCLRTQLGCEPCLEVKRQQRATDLLNKESEKDRYRHPSEKG